MRSSNGLTALLSLSIATLLLSGCAAERPPVNLANLPQSNATGLPLGAKRGPVKGTLTPEETKAQFKSLAADEYVVKKGDTLWSIANHFLKDPYYWPEIWYDNSQIKNPHKIYPGDRIGIMYIGGRPRLGITMRPHMRYEGDSAAISSIPLDVIKPFFSYDQIMTQAELDATPYILTNRDDALSASMGDVIYARPALTDSLDNYAIVRQGKHLVDPVTGASLGYRTIYEGEAKIMQRGDPTELRIIKSEREVNKGDRLVPMIGEPFDHDITPSIPAVPIDAVIIDLPDAITQVGTYQVAIINAGKDNGLVPGDMLRISKPGRVVKDTYTQNPKELKQGKGIDALLPHPPLVKLPDFPIGTAMVFRTYDHASYVLVVKTKRPIHIGDLAQTPTAD
ncbi:LysM peptidoglycan-binding domain-containing protein [Halothiobacillus diazotrophicus]|uniref:LysM peptidoglycan-binding domain-containing protein n=1 Tax=Halothiobacillus diazotrophicus TaxID=1860122 RepID=UPI0018D3550F|nr:LysM peptidoglycan-binding domain-containing protein [Halothiobacillus diazotrophicus]